MFHSYSPPFRTGKPWRANGVPTDRGSARGQREPGTIVVRYKNNQYQGGTLGPFLYCPGLKSANVNALTPRAAPWTATSGWSLSIPQAFLSSATQSLQTTQSSPNQAMRPEVTALYALVLHSHSTDIYTFRDPPHPNYIIINHRFANQFSAIVWRPNLYAKVVTADS